MAGAMAFVLGLVVTSATVLLVWIVTSHNVIVVVEETASGNDDLVWPDEPMMDWLWHAVYLAWVILVWIMPAVLFGRFATEGTEEYYRPLYVILYGASAFWVVFPISLLSTMAAESRWAVLHLGLIQRLFKRLPSLMLFYGCTAVLMIVVVPTIFWHFRDEKGWSVLVFGPLVGTAIMVYARLLGRLANLVRLTKVSPKKAKKKPRPTEAGLPAEPLQE